MSMGKSTKDMTPVELERDRERKRRHAERLRIRWHEDEEYRAQKKAQARDYRLKSRYGMTYEEFCAQIDAQGGVCAVCKTQPLNKDIVPRVESERTVVDHCHAQGHVRGILCSPCNLMLGYAQDEIWRLEAAIEYLKRGRQA